MTCRIVTTWLLLFSVAMPSGCNDAGAVAQRAPDAPVAAASHLAEASPGQPRSLAEPTSADWRWTFVEDFDRDIAVFESVFWEPLDTTSLRALIRDSPLVKGKTVLEIGTGSGLISLCCLQAGASRVVATDINPAAVDNAQFNARRLGLSDRLDVRLVPIDNAGAYSVIEPSERFDLIISNPPWELSEKPPDQIADYALYDPHFELMRTMLRGHATHLAPEGRFLLAYGCVTAIRKLQATAASEGLTWKILDDRQLDDLPELFLPGMLLEIAP
ncbi:MAG: class I SAM-dependent methyltransferase [Planctomycetaceae bacterium]|nr:class I SAM-dependent methyltransferase [Planctomycetaceae bacterium]